MESKVGLGTVQFGLNYGVSNTRGKTPADEVPAILEQSLLRGVRVLDTAASYGDSELVLGQNFEVVKNFRIVTKTTAVQAEDVAPQFLMSLQRLKHSSVDGLLVHHCKSLLGPNGDSIYRELLKLKEKGLVKKIGASTYHPEEIDLLLSKYKLDLVQVPVNLLDQRLIASGRLMELKSRGIEIHARSAFLQGLLLFSPDHLPLKFSRIRTSLEKLQAYAEQNKLSVLELTLGFVLAQPEIDFTICGVNDIRQFSQIVDASQKIVDAAALSGFAIDDIQILDPNFWEKL